MQNPASEYWNVILPSLGVTAYGTATMRVRSRLSAAFASSTGNTYGFGSKASTAPAGPTASAIGTAVSPECAPMSMATSPGRRNSRSESTTGWRISFGSSEG